MKFTSCLLLLVALAACGGDCDDATIEEICVPGACAPPLPRFLSRASAKSWADTVVEAASQALGEDS